MNFGTYLKTARQERGISLDRISADTKIKRALLADLEANDLSRWPKHRVYRHGFLRSYAKTVGLNPANLIARFDREFPDEHPVAFHSRRPPVAETSPQRLTRNAAVLAVALGVLLGVALSILDTDSDAGVTDGPSTIDARPSTIDHRLSTIDHRPSTIDPRPSTIDDHASHLDASDIEGELRIVSTPPEAFVTVNGIGRGKTPIRVRYLPLGSYTIRAVHPGYKSGETRVTLGPEQPNRTVTVVLRDDAAN